MVENKESLNVIKSNIRIAQVQAKDVLSKKEKLSRYNSASFDYSIDLITLQDVYKKVYRNNKCIEKDETGQPFTKQVISVKFDYRSDDFNKRELREYIYKKGFEIGDIKYVRWKRSSGSAREGKCLFVNEKLYDRLHKIDCCSLNIDENKEIDLASFEAYISLTSSSIIDTLKIEPYQILVVDDIEKTFVEKVNAVEVDNNLICCNESEMEITNNVTDGESLIDKSIMGIYKDKGMLLLRNKFFKSCCFNSNIQEWFRDNEITEIAQLKGFTLAEQIEDIKLITTPSSIKFLKFGELDNWFQKIDLEFGICKYEKETHFDEGNKVQTHYQMLNSLQLTEDDCKELLKETIRVFKEYYHSDKYIDYLRSIDYNPSEYKNSDDLILHLVNYFPDIIKTEYFRKHMQKVNKAYKERVLRGNILINGNYSVLLSAPVELLQSTINESKIEYTDFKGQQIMSKRFDYNKEIIAIRSPHISAGNILIAENIYNETIDKYINLTNEIVVINATDNALMDRLGGCDMDSDAVLLTDNEILIKSAKKNYSDFLVPINKIESSKIKRKYTATDLAELDHQTSQNLIGEIVNFSQLLNSIMWDKLKNVEEYDKQSIFNDICILSVLSGIEIDKAKKQVDIDAKSVIREIRNSYIGEEYPLFFRKIKKDIDILNEQIKKINAQIKDSEEDEVEELLSSLEEIKEHKEKKNKRYKHLDTAMDYVFEIAKKEIDGRKGRRVTRKMKLSEVLIDIKPKNITTHQKKILNATSKMLKEFTDANAKIFCNYKDSTNEEKQIILEDYSERKSQIVNYILKYKDWKEIIYLLIKENENNGLNNLIMNTVLTPCLVKNIQKSGNCKQENSECCIENIYNIVEE